MKLLFKKNRIKYTVKGNAYRTLILEKKLFLKHMKTAIDTILHTTLKGPITI